MSSKQISIVVAAVDKATGPVRAVAASVAGLGGQATKTADQVEKASKRGGTSIFTVANAMKALVAGFAVRSGVSAFNETAKTLETIGDQAARLNMPVEQLSKLRYAAELANVDFGELTDGVAKMGKNVAQFVTTGGGKAADSLRRLGVPLRDANGNIREMSELMPDLLDSIAAKDPTQRLLYLNKIFGENGDKFLHFINEGTQRLRVYYEEAKRLNVVFTPEQIEAAKNYRDSLDRITAAWLGVKAKVVEALGPLLAEMNNRLAGFIAAVPEMVGNLAREIGDALQGDSKAQWKLLQWMDSIVGLVKATAEVCALAVLAIVRALMRSLIEIVDSSLGDYFAVLPEKLAIMLARTEAGIAKSLTQLLPDGWITKQMKVLTSTAVSALDAMNASINYKLKEQADARAKIATSGGSGLNWTQEWLDLMKQAGAIMDPAVEFFASATDGVLGFTAALAKTSIMGLEAKMELVGIAETITKIKDELIPGIKFEDVVNGARDAAAELMLQANDVAGFVKSAVVSVAQSISSGLSNAIVDVVSGTKSLKAAFSELLSSTLRQVSQLILQFLILRAIAGIAGSMFPAAAAGTGNLMEPGMVEGVALGANLNRGGVASRFNVPVYRFAAGGLVPGANVHRDIIPALLTPGERVINERGARATSASAWNYANAGGRLEPAGGGGGGGNVSVVVNVAYHAAAGGAQKSDGVAAREMERVVVGAVIKGMSQNPAAAARLRKLIGAG